MEKDQITRRVSKRVLFAFPTLLLSAVLQVPAADWPQYRGPNRDGRSTEKGLLASWPADGPEIVWRVSLGAGYSGISVADGNLVTQYSADGTEWAAAHDAATGGQVWRFEMDSERRDAQGDGPRATPTIDGDLVYVVGAKAKLFALDRKTGQTTWGVDLMADHGAVIPEWGYSSSPLVEEGRLIVDVGAGDDHSVMAFDKRTGDLVWQASSHRPSYSSPLAVTLSGERQLLIFNADGLLGLAANDGRLLWQTPWTTSYDVNAAMPIFVPRERIFISSGYDTGAAVYQVSNQDGSFAVEEVWRNRNMKNQFNSSILVGGYIYGFDGDTFKCISAASGEDIWKVRRVFEQGSLIYADGHLLVLGGEGVLGLVEATPNGYNLKSKTEIFDGKSWTMPTLSDGILYLRDFDEMLALKVGSAG